MRWTAFTMALLLASQQAVAAPDWALYAKAENGDQGFVDRASLKINAGVRLVWTMIEKATPGTHEGKPLKTWIALVEADCGERAHRSVRQVGYLPDGSVLYEQNAPGSWRRVVAESMGEIRLQAICDLPAVPK
jgi:hypothetical protein